MYVIKQNYFTKSIMIFKKDEKIKKKLKIKKRNYCKKIWKNVYIKIKAIF